MAEDEKARRQEAGDPTQEPSQEERIEKLNERIAELTDGKMTFDGADDLPPDVREQFLENVVAIEETGWSRPADHLEKGGLELVPPEELDDEAVREKLREVIHAMALRNMYVMHTDHLSDRELYSALLESLREESFMGSPEPTAGFHYGIDILGSYGDEEMYLYNKYYASDESRESWLREFPDYDMPEREKPPYDRDRLLPQAEMTPPPQLDLDELLDEDGNLPGDDDLVM